MHASFSPMSCTPSLLLQFGYYYYYYSSSYDYCYDYCYSDYCYYDYYCSCSCSSLNECLVITPLPSEESPPEVFPESCRQ